jgi:hypothetical protein
MQRVVVILHKEGFIYRPTNKQASEGNTESEKSEKRVYSPKDFTSGKEDDGGEDAVKDDGITGANSTTPAHVIYIMVILKHLHCSVAIWVSEQILS